MSQDNLDSLPATGSDWDAAWSAVYRLDAARRSIQQNADDRRDPRRVAPDQLAADIAEIERAAAALRKAEPALEEWTERPRRAAGKPRSIWLLIGVLWLSSALVAAGAVAAIAAFVG
jgi:hypothetical protein